MSGQPYVYAKDASMYRDKYMEALGARANLDDMVLQAVKTYKSTGQLPAISSMPDNRTTSEKLADIEKLKIGLLSDLKPLMGSQMAQAVVQGVLNSPYNTDGSLFTFFAQRATDIVKNAQVNYKYGIKGDANDVEKFVQIVENMYSSSKSLGDTAKKFFNTIGNSYSGMTRDSFYKIRDAYFFTLARLHRQDLRYVKTPAMNATLNEITRRFDWFGKLITNDNVYQLIDNIVSQSQYTTPILRPNPASGTPPRFNLATPLTADKIKDIIDYTAVFPRPENIRSFLNQIDKILDRIDLEKRTLAQRKNAVYDDPKSNNSQLIHEILINLLSILPPIPDDPLIDDFVNSLPPLSDSIPSSSSSSKPKGSVDGGLSVDAESLGLPASDTPSFTAYRDDLAETEQFIEGIDEEIERIEEKEFEISQLLGQAARARDHDEIDRLQELRERMRQEKIYLIEQKTAILQQQTRLNRERVARNTRASTPSVGTSDSGIEWDFQQRSPNASIQGSTQSSSDSSSQPPPPPYPRRGAVVTDPLSVDHPNTVHMTDAQRSAMHEVNDAVRQFQQRYNTIVEEFAEQEEAIKSRPMRQHEFSFDIVQAIEDAGQIEILNNRVNSAYRRRISTLNPIIDIMNFNFYMPGPVSSAGGNGLRRRRGRPKGSGVGKTPFHAKVDASQGIKPSSKYIPFGKYVIDTTKLADNQVALKYPKGGSVIGFPIYKTSNHMTSVLKKIVGGGMPSYEDYSNLTEEEKRYLYTVSKKSDILSKLNVPAPSKDQQDKDNHQFEVMKGEIMSGNDSKDLVKNFKLLILKMSKRGDLPKAQVAELLQDLVELGY